jgi:hypothetical protein
VVFTSFPTKALHFSFFPSFLTWKFLLHLVKLLIMQFSPPCYEGVSKYVTDWSKTAVMDVIGFLCVSLGSSTVQLHDSLGSRRACSCSEAGFSSQNCIQCQIKYMEPKSKYKFVLFFFVIFAFALSFIFSVSIALLKVMLIEETHSLWFCLIYCICIEEFPNFISVLKMS